MRRQFEAARGPGTAPGTDEETAVRRKDAGRPLRRAVFFDKDGTLVENVPYNVDIARIRLAAGAEVALRMLSEAGFDIYVISNQSGVAEGYFPESALAAVEAELARRLAGFGVELAGFFYCPHAAEPAPDALACECRKPQPGLILRAAEWHGIDLAASWFVGDILTDVEAGNRAGCRSLIVGDEPLPPREELAEVCRPYAVCEDLEAAARLILQSEVTPS